MIKLENVSYTYMKGGPFEKKALDNVSLEVRGIEPLSKEVSSRGTTSVVNG